MANQITTVADEMGSEQQQQQHWVEHQASAAEKSGRGQLASVEDLVVNKKVKKKLEE